jgi:hypothetical protein
VLIIDGFHHALVKLPFLPKAIDSKKIDSKKNELNEFEKDKSPTISGADPEQGRQANEQDAGLSF